MPAKSFPPQPKALITDSELKHLQREGPVPGLHSSISEELSRSTAFWLGEESPLAGHLPGFKPRQGQAEMALGRSGGLWGRHDRLWWRAGTGTGKTLAYLAPAVLSGLKVVVSTGTRTLQDQIAQKELPLLKSAMHAGLRWAVLKGRTNYLCLRKYMRFSAQPDLGLENAESGLAALSGWLEGSKDGDLDHVRGKGLSAGLLAEVSSTSEQCLGARLPQAGGLLSDGGPPEGGRGRYSGGEPPSFPGRPQT